MLQSYSFKVAKDVKEQDWKYQMRLMDASLLKLRLLKNHRPPRREGRSSQVCSAWGMDAMELPQKDTDGSATVVEEVLRIHRREMAALLTDWLSRLDVTLATSLVPTGIRSPNPQAYGIRSSIRTARSGWKPSKASTKSGFRLEDETSDPESALEDQGGCVMSPSLSPKAAQTPEDSIEEGSEMESATSPMRPARMDSALSYEEAKMTDVEISKAWHMGLGSGGLRGAPRASLTLGWWNKFRLQVANAMNSEKATAFWTFLILTNSIFLGIHLQWSSTARESTPNDTFDVIHLVYAVLFTLEVGLRIIAFGPREYVCNKDWKWNWLDSFVVITAWIEFVADKVAAGGGDMRGTNTNLRIIRVLRLGRLVRVMRIVRVVRFIRALRTLVASLMGTLKSLFWSFLLLFLVIYIFGILFTDVALDFAMENNLADDNLTVASCLQTHGLNKQKP